MKVKISAEEDLLSQLSKTYKLFVHTQQETRQSIATKDLATQAIDNSLLNAKYCTQVRKSVKFCERAASFE